MSGYKRALEHYDNAFSCFKEINHLFGLYQAKKREASLLEYLSNSLEPAEKTELNIKETAREEAKRQLEIQEKRFREYIAVNGTKNCPYIERAHGEEIALLTEIVYSNNR